MLGHKIIAAAANDKPFDIKELVNEALHLKANELLSEGFKIVADKQYGGIFEGRARLGKAASQRTKDKDKLYGNRKLRNAMKSMNKPGMTRSDKHRAQKKAGQVAIDNAERFNKRNGI